MVNNANLNTLAIDRKIHLLNLSVILKAYLTTLSMLPSIFEKAFGNLSLEQLKKKYTTKESQFVWINGMHIHYRLTGKGPLLLLVHGIGSSLHTWSEWHDYLSKDFTVVSLDIPGFGLTGGHPYHDYSFPMYNSVFDQLLDHLQADKVFMVGNSLGGLLTWHYALHAPERLHKIVLMDAAGFNTTKAELSDIGFHLTIHPFTKKISHYFTPRSLIKSSYSNAVYDASKITEKQVDTYYELLLRKGNRENFSAILENLILTNNNPVGSIRKIQTPTLIMWGEEDNLINVSCAYKFKQTIKGSKLLIYEKVGHLPMEEIPERSAQDTKSFLLDNQNDE